MLRHAPWPQGIEERPPCLACHSFPHKWLTLTSPFPLWDCFTPPDLRPCLLLVDWMLLTYLEAVACFVLCQHSTWHIPGISRNISFLLPSGWKTSTSHHNGALKLVPCRRIQEKEAISTVGSQRAPLFFADGYRSTSFERRNKYCWSWWFPGLGSLRTQGQPWL